MHTMYNTLGTVADHGGVLTIFVSQCAPSACLWHHSAHDGGIHPLGHPATPVHPKTILFCTHSHLDVCPSYLNLPGHGVDHPWHPDQHCGHGLNPDRHQYPSGTPGGQNPEQRISKPFHGQRSRRLQPSAGPGRVFGAGSHQHAAGSLPVAAVLAVAAECGRGGTRAAIPGSLGGVNHCGWVGCRGGCGWVGGYVGARWWVC